MGWVVKTCLQRCERGKRLGIPVHRSGRGESLPSRVRGGNVAATPTVFRRYDAFLADRVGESRFLSDVMYRGLRMVDARYCIENGRFERAAEAAVAERTDLRRQWGLASWRHCFYFAGSLKRKGSNSAGTVKSV